VAYAYNHSYLGSGARRIIFEHHLGKRVSNTLSKRASQIGWEHTCNPSYMGVKGRQEDHNLRLAHSKSMSLLLKNNKAKRDEGQEL
jgi:hypothetical protein